MDEDKAPVGWSTYHELRFLQELRGHAGHTRAEMLTLYAEAVRRRVNWGGIDRAKVMDYLGDELTSEGLERAISAFRQAQA